MARLRTVALAVSAVLLVLALAGSGQGTDEQTYLQFNLCGNACSTGSLPVVLHIEDAVRDRQPYGLTLNELCENQYTHLSGDLPGYAGRFEPTGPRCHNGTRYGIAILVRARSTTLVGSWELPNPAGDETRRLVCVRPAGPHAPVVCVTHVSNESGNIEAQVAAIADHLHGLLGHGPVILGGDFNTDPPDARLNPVYAGFWDADASGDHRTYQRHKYDYLFLSRGDWSVAATDAGDIAAGRSDHNALWARVLPLSSRLP
jgi:endonuclease/exonuclease/phosphatase family metal-dependent hydrolase